MPAADGIPTVSAGGLRALLTAAWGTDQRLTAAAAALTGLSAAMPVAFAVASGALIGAVPAAVADGSGSSSADSLWRWLVVVAALFVVQRTLDQVRTAVASEIGWRTQIRLRRRVLAAALAPSGIAHLENQEMLDRLALARGVDDGRFSPQRAMESASNLAVTFLAAGGAAVVLMGFRWWVGLGLGVGFWFFGQLARRKFHLIVRVLANQVPGLRRSQWFCDAATGGATKETRVFGLGGFLTDRFRTHWLDAMEAVWRERSGLAPTFMLVPVALGLLRLGAVYFLVATAQRGGLSAAELGVYVQAVIGVAAFATLDDDSWNLAQGLVSIPPALELERDLVAPAAIGHTPAAEDTPATSIRFEAVGFTYPGTKTEVFGRLDLEIPAGASTAIVGLNGVGKTTVVKLLARLYDPTSGRITVDGVDLRELEPRHWQRRIAAIFQDFNRYELSVAENIGWGAPEVAGDRGHLERAAERAGAGSLIADLPNGWDTVLSPKFTDGVDLSGGQWQRIALARALFAVEGGARILVLDEPTAHLDVRAEVELYDRFIELTAGLTTVVVSHRFSTVRRADRIVVIDGGEVVECGSHGALLAADGPYARLFRLQAARFSTDGAVDLDEGHLLDAAAMAEARGD